MSDIVELIDSCLDDWAVSGDAMRWEPYWDEPVVRDPVGAIERLMLEGLDGYTATVEQMQRAIRFWGTHRAAFVKVMNGYAEVWHRIFREVGDFTVLAYANLEAAPSLADTHHIAPETPQERALDARRNRHTGPPAPRLDGRR